MSERNPHVVIVSHFFEPSVNRIIGRLDQLGIPWLRINTEAFPLVSTGTLRFLDSKPAQVDFSTGGTTVSLDCVRAVWFRRVGSPLIADGMTEYESDFVIGEARAFLEGLFSLAKARWVNDRWKERLASSKPAQLDAAQQLGLRIPRTIITNDPEEVRDFHAVNCSLGFQTLFKPLSGFSPNGDLFLSHFADAHGPCLKAKPRVPKKRSEPSSLIFAQLLDNARLQFIENVGICPAIFQEFLPKLSDIRVTVVGEQIFSCEIHSQEFAQTRIDFRRMVQLNGTERLRHTPCRLPPHIESKVRMLMEHFGLLFGCFDFVRTMDGEYVFLEVNPSGQWLWIEDLTELPISDALVDLLTKSA